MSYSIFFHFLFVKPFLSPLSRGQVLKEKISIEKFRLCRSFSGFSMVEAMIATALLSVVILGVYSAALMMDKVRYVGNIRLELYDNAVLVMAKIIKHARAGATATVTNGNILTITRASWTYSFTYSAANSSITYDPDTSVGGNEREILTNVLTIPGVNVFAINNSLVTVTFGVQQTNTTNGTRQRFVLESSACLRNN